MRLYKFRHGVAWPQASAVVLLLAGCASHPRGPCGPRCAEIDSAMHILEYPTQRLTILRRIAGYRDLSQHEQTYLVNAVFVGGFSEDVADALVTLIENPVATAETRAQIRKKLKGSRLLGRFERRVIEALTQADRAATRPATPPTTRAAP